MWLWQQAASAPATGADGAQGPPPLPAPPSAPASHQGLAGCAFDPMAAEGTQFKIAFYVWDSGSPPLNASTTRVVTLSKACPASDAPNLCKDLSGQPFCSGAGLALLLIGATSRALQQPCTCPNHCLASR